MEWMEWMEWMDGRVRGYGLDVLDILEREGWMGKDWLDIVERESEGEIDSRKGVGVGFG